MGMTSLRSLCLFLSCLCAVSSRSFSRPLEFPVGPGTYSVNRTYLTDAIDNNLDVYAPNGPGSFPVFYLITGFGGIVTTEDYGDILALIASHGIVAVGVWKFGIPADSFTPSWMDQTIKYVEENLERNLIENNGYDADFRIDYKNSFIGGHSAGSHVPVSQLQTHCLNFRGMILINPVDGADPIGVVPKFVITPGEPVNFSIPTLQISAGLDPVKGPSGLACAPDKLSGYRFYNAMTGPTWLINATIYGHQDFLDPDFIEGLEVSQFCLTNPETKKEPYRNFVAEKIVSFINGVLDPVNNCAFFDNLEIGTGDVEATHEYKSNGWQKCSVTKCVLNE